MTAKEVQHFAADNEHWIYDQETGGLSELGQYYFKAFTHASAMLFNIGGGAAMDRRKQHDYAFLKTKEYAKSLGIEIPWK